MGEEAMRLAVLLPLTIIPGSAVAVVVFYMVLRFIFGKEVLP